MRRRLKIAAYVVSLIVLGSSVWGPASVMAQAFPSGGGLGHAFGRIGPVVVPDSQQWIRLHDVECDSRGCHGPRVHAERQHQVRDALQVGAADSYGHGQSSCWVRVVNRLDGWDSGDSRVAGCDRRSARGLGKSQCGRAHRGRGTTQHYTVLAVHCGCHGGRRGFSFWEYAGAARQRDGRN